MKTIAFILSVIVVFSTTYSMILPAITLSDSAAEEEPGIFFEDTEELTAGEETEFTYEEEYTEEFPEEPETEPEAEAEPDPEWDYEYEEEAEEWDSDPGETEEVDDLALEGAEENLYEAEDAVTTEDGADDQPEAGQTEVQTEPASQDDAESVTVSPEVYEEFLTSEQSVQDGRYLIVRITDDGRYVAMNRDGAVVPVDYNADDNTASCDDENQELVWVKSGNSLHTPDDERYVRLTDESVGFSVVFDEPSSVSIEKPDDHQYAGAVYRTVVTDGVPEYYALVLSEDQTYFTAVAIDTKPVKRTILAKEAPSDPNESETESDDEPVLEEASLDAESAWETVSSEVESAVEMTVSEVDSVAEGVESEVDSVAEGVFSDAESAAEEVLTVYESGERTIQVEGADYTIHISWPAEAMIPEDAVFTAVSLDQKKGYETYKEEALNVAAGEDSDARKRSSALGVFDLTITDAAGAVIEPSAPVSVSVDFGESLDPETSVLAVHFPGTGEQPEEDDGIEYDEVKINVDASTAAAIDAVNEDGAVSFEADSFSVYVIVGTTIEKNVLASDGKNYKVTVTYGAETGIPEGAELEVEEILPGENSDVSASSAYDEYVSKTENALGENEKVAFARFFDINIMKDGVEIQPDNPVDVKIELADELTEDVKTVHFGNEVEMLDTVLVDAEILNNAVEFTANGFSVYGVVLTETIEANIITADGSTYKITVNYNEDARIPEGSVLQVRELTGEEYAVYRTKSAGVLCWNAADISYARFFDITIEYQGEEIQPFAPVSVSVELVNNGEIRTDDVQVVHFGSRAEVIDSVSDLSGNDYNIEFEAEGFSVYAIIGGDQSDPETYSIKYVFRYPDGTTPYTFVNENGKTVDYQYVTNGEAPYNVGTPTDEDLQQDGQEFVGWYGKNTDGTWESAPTIDIEGNGKVVTGLTAHVDEKILYPRYDHAYYVYYYDETATLNSDGSVDQNIYMIDVIYQEEIDTGKYHTTVTKDGKEEPKIDYIPNMPTEAFLGWSTTPGYSSDSDVEEEVDIPEEGVIRLFPVTAPVYWISFDKNDWDYTAESDETKADWKQENGEWVYVGANNGGTHTRKGTGALYVAPMYTLQGERISDRYDSIPTTSRPGYDFAGWFLPDGTQLTSNYQPTADVTVTAKWTPSNNQSYNVIYWRQNATDEVDAETKTYSYDHSETRYAQTGASVSLTAADRNGAGTGFNFNESASTVTATVAADGSTVLNVYYDRNVYAMVFNVPGYGYAYTPSDSGTYGYIDGDFVPLTQSISGTTTEYYWARNGTEYTGTVYIRQNNSYVVWDGVYRDNVTYYGNYNGYAREITRVSRTVNTYSYSYNGQEYTGPRFTRSNSNGINYSGYGYHKTAKVILALYGHSIKDSFPIEGSDGASYDGWSWSDMSGNTYSYVLKTVEEMPAANVIFRGYSRPKTNLIYYYVEALPGATDTRSFNGKEYVLYKSVYHSYNYLTYDEEYHPINGFERNRAWAEPKFGTNNQASIPSSGENYLYYNRNSYNLEFWDSFDSTQIGDAVSVPYEMPLTSYENTVSVSSDASTLTYGSTTLSHEGYVFTGWYADPECTKPFDFSAEIMPSNAVKVYAGWRKLRYRVWVQPNGGQLSSSESTYFRANWGELIQEYSDVQNTRNYIEDDEGDYSYVYIADTSNEARVAYYKKTSELTTITLYNDDGTELVSYNEGDHTDGKTYSYKTGVYTFVGWYRVNGEIDDDTPPSLGRDADEIWNFNNPVTENIAIKAIWKRQGTFTIVYSDTSLDGEQGSLSPDIHDQNVYYDLAQAVAEKAATPPEGNYVFKGWRTPDGEIHQPGDLYTIKSDYAEPVEGQTETYTYTLTPIFEKLDASSLTYDVNGGSGILSNPGSAEKGCTTDTNALKNIVMDTAVTLSDGDGFTKPGYVLTGWNSNTDPNAADAIHFDLGGTYGISEKENTLYAEWTPVCFDLEFLKQGEELKEVMFESEYEPLNGAVFSLSGDGVSETATSATIDDHVGTVKFENVRPGDNSSLSLIETSAPTGYQKDDSTYTVTWETPKAPYTFITIDGVKYIQATGVSLKNADGDTVTEIINKRPFVSLTLYKVDSTDTSKKLDDAEFQLTRDNNGAASNYTRGDHVDGIYVTVNGEFVMDLADGEYTLTEKKPPEGYIITTNAYSFTVEDGVITGDDIDVDEDGNYLITVTNEPGVALPSTGGSGTNLIYLLGIMLTGIAGTGLVMKKRRRA